MLSNDQSSWWLWAVFFFNYPCIIYFSLHYSQKLIQLFQSLQIPSPHPMPFKSHNSTTVFKRRLWWFKLCFLTFHSSALQNIIKFFLSLSFLVPIFQEDIYLSFQFPYFAYLSHFFSVAFYIFMHAQLFINF